MDVYRKCGLFWRYGISGPSSSTSRLTYPEPGLSLTRDCTTIDDCLSVRVSDTRTTATLQFNLLLYPAYGQDPIQIPYTVYVTPCLNQAFTVPVQPPVQLISRSAKRDNIFELAVSPTILNRFVSQNPSECPVLNMQF